MRPSSIALNSAALCFVAAMLSGCLAASVAGAAIGVTAKGVGMAAHGVGSAVGAVTGGDKKDDKSGG